MIYAQYFIGLLKYIVCGNIYFCRCRYLELGNHPALHGPKLDITNALTVISKSQLKLHTLGLVNCGIAESPNVAIFRAIKGKLQHITFWQCSANLKTALLGISVDVLIEESFKSGISTVSKKRWRKKFPTKFLMNNISW